MSKVRYAGVFGRRNSGKSSLINIITGQQVSITSGSRGTVADHVKKRTEIFGVGQVVFVDTAGIDDDGEPGSQRVAGTKEVISEIDIALLLFTNNQLGSFEIDLLNQLREEEIPVIIIHNQSDIIALDEGVAIELSEKYGVDVVEFSCNLLDQQLQKEAVELLTSLIVKSFADVK